MTLTGTIAEYNTGPANMTELDISGVFDIIDVAQPTPEVPIVSTGDLRWPTEAEQWGTVMVQVEDAVVTGNEFQYDLIEIDDGTGSVLVDDDSDAIQTHYETYPKPPVGSLAIHRGLGLSSLWKQRSFNSI